MSRTLAGTPRQLTTYTHLSCQICSSNFFLYPIRLWVNMTFSLNKTGATVASSTLICVASSSNCLRLIAASLCAALLCIYRVVTSGSHGPLSYKSKASLIKKKSYVLDVGKPDDVVHEKTPPSATTIKQSPQVLLKSEAVQLLCRVSVQSVKETKQVKVNPSAQPLNWQSSILTGQK